MDNSVWYRTCVLVALALVVAFANKATALEWYEGGTLHGKTIMDWNTATEQNRLATSGDIILSIRGNLKFDLNSIEKIKIKAYGLSKCITSATSGNQDLENQQVSEMAILCVYQMNWNK